MPRFSYTAIDSTGREKSGSLDAENENVARNRLSGQGLMVSSIVADKAGGKGKRGKKAAAAASPAKSINTEVLTIFTRQLATLLQSGLPLLRALEVMARQEKKPSFHAVIESVSEKVKSGNNLSEGLSQHPKIFPPIYINMVKAGEAGGVLDTVLGRLASFMEKDLRTKKKIQSAMVYPVVIMVVAFIIVMGLMIGIVPRFEEIFAKILKGKPMPPLTEALMAVSDFITPSNLVEGIILLAVIVVVIVGGKFFLGSTFGKRIIDWLALNSPKIGELGTKAAVSRFSRTFGTLLSSGVPILKALNITRDVIGNHYISKALSKVHDRVRDGENVATPLDQQKVFPVMVTSMVQVGEETGDLPSMLNRIADNYDEDLDNAVSSITSIIEPIMIVFLAVIVGVIVIALFLPIIGIVEEMMAGA